MRKILYCLAKKLAQVILESTAPATDEPSQTPEPTNTESPTTEPSEKLEIVKMTPADGSFAGCSGTFGTQRSNNYLGKQRGKNRIYWFSTDNAKAQPLFSNLPASGSQVIDFPCSFGSSVVTVTVSLPVEILRTNQLL